MPDYQLGKIYKITGINKENIELVYIGSTCQLLCMRMGGHRRDLKYSSKIIFETCSNILITLIENYPCNSKEELVKQERSYFDKFDCVNSNKPILYEGETKENLKKYREEHKDYFREHNKNYNEEHKEEIREQKAIYYENHKEQFRENHKKWYEENKEQIVEQRKEKVTCECGHIVIKTHIRRHERSKKHITYLEQKK